MRMKLLTLLAAAGAFPATAGAAVVNSTLVPFAMTTTTYTQDFDTLAPTGTSGLLPAGFQISETSAGTAANGQYTAGNTSTGDTYSFGTGANPERALGSLASGTLTSIQFGGIFSNGLASTITSLNFDYFGEQWRQGSNNTGAVPNQLVFEYLVGATSISEGSWVAMSNLNFSALAAVGTSALDGNAAANRTNITGTITGLSIAAGQQFGFRWTDVDSTGGDAGLAVDNLNITAGISDVVPPAPAVPEPATWGLMVLGLGMVGAGLRRRQGRQSLAIA